ncbi:MAG: signal peptide peptidase SppA [Rhodospirillaceae bacterium]|nr:signal peptide peptidase SppA [Rhodospirillaceae bacterium]|tara:strand:- start:298 stop:1215 length:918 start_codon:yes stop_codon:yes gene_type:complete
MSFEADQTVDRRRLKRQIGVWRLLAIGFAVALVVVLAEWSGADRVVRGDYVAVLSVEGIITSNRQREEALDRIAEDPHATALVVWVDSPGGGTYASEVLYRAIRRVAQEKPVVAVMGTVAASGGYMTAIAADYIVARESTLTGSIGVLWEATNVVGLMETLGIESDTIKSAPLKAQPSPFERLSDAGRAATQAVVDDTQRMFVAMVRERRSIRPVDMGMAISGRVFTGRMAVELGLIDALGGEREALAWLEEAQGVSADLPLLPVEIEREWPLGTPVASWFRKTFLPEELNLDGLISVWQPSNDL